MFVIEIKWAFSHNDIIGNERAIKRFNNLNKDVPMPSLYNSKHLKKNQTKITQYIEKLVGYERCQSKRNKKPSLLSRSYNNISRNKGIVITRAVNL